MTGYADYLEATSSGGKTVVSLKVPDEGIDESYTLLKMPNKDSKLVEEARKDILQTIDLKSMTENISLCVPLLNISYDALNGVSSGTIGLSAEVTKIKDKFSLTLDKSLVVMTGFKAQTKTAVDSFLEAYDYLTDPDYISANGIKLACDLLSDVQKKAIKMQTDANELAQTFSLVQAAANDLTVKVTELRDLDSAQKEAALKRLAKFKAQAEAMKTVKDDLDETVQQYQKDCDKISAQLKRAEDHEFSLALTSTIISGVTTLFQKTPELLSKSKSANDFSNAQSNADTEQQKQYEAKQAEVTRLEKRKSELTNKIKELDEQLKAETVSAEEKVAIREKKNDLTKESLDLSKQLSQAQTQADTLKKLLADVSPVGGLNETTAKLDQMSERAGLKSEALSTRLESIQEKKFIFEKQKVDVMKQLAELTMEIANASTEDRDLELVLNSLIMAIQCMHQVKIYIAEIALFWKNVGSFCERLKENVQHTNELLKAQQTSENYCALFVKPRFVVAYFSNIVNWTALNAVSIEYLSAFNQTRKDFQAGEKLPELPAKEHWQRAQKTALAVENQIGRIVNPA